jgi:hypothetical protein
MEIFPTRVDLIWHPCQIPPPPDLSTIFTRARLRAPTPSEGGLKTHFLDRGFDWHVECQGLSDLDRSMNESISLFRNLFQCSVNNTGSRLKMDFEIH